MTPRPARAAVDGVTGPRTRRAVRAYRHGRATFPDAHARADELARVAAALRRSRALSARQAEAIAGVVTYLRDIADLGVPLPPVRPADDPTW